MRCIADLRARLEPWKYSSDVRSGSNSEVDARNPYVRFPPVSD
jgi:hypothetical protein